MTRTAAEQDLDTFMSMINQNCATKLAELDREASLSNAGVGRTGVGSLVLIGGASNTTNAGDGSGQNMPPTVILNYAIRL
jgi:hypothetical protein